LSAIIFGVLTNAARKSKVGPSKLDPQRRIQQEISNNRRLQMDRAMFPSDSITFKVSTGGNSAESRPVVLSMDRI
jgi:hypothetical protein